MGNIRCSSVLGGRCIIRVLLLNVHGLGLEIHHESLNRLRRLLLRLVAKRGQKLDNRRRLLFSKSEVGGANSTRRCSLNGAVRCRLHHFLDLVRIDSRKPYSLLLRCQFAHEVLLLLGEGCRLPPHIF